MGGQHILCLFSILLFSWTSHSWLIQQHQSAGVPRFGGLRLDANNPKKYYVDAEFERVNTASDESSEEAPARKDDLEVLEQQRKSLMDLSLDSDPEIRETRIPFFDDDQALDVKLSFMAELDGVKYGIGVPFDPAVALVAEDSDGSATFLSPDAEENEELMQMMASLLNEHLGTDLQLKRTPRVLTVVGPLDNYTKNWQDKVLPKPFTMEELLETDEYDGLDFFHQFMKSELGEKEYTKIMNEEDDEEVDDELAALFNIPGLGTESDDVKGMDELARTVFDDESEQMKQLEKFGNIDGETTLKLVGYIIPGGSSYTLVQLIQPYVVVGKYVPKEDDSHFELLSEEEALVIEPRLSEVCREDLERAGFTLSR